ncbi:hypothetical protein Mal33_21430 [Rosistilla oblonga]|uniref:Uncharacterized protein n=1 Tax=Rosistilla oblonga TaxID=2527990 RepID=A0A518ISU1_9BACT|nr:hypothetical protein Mal33_21430 [Rosistilla oblonga]
MTAGASAAAVVTGSSRFANACRFKELLDWFSSRLIVAPASQVVGLLSQLETGDREFSVDDLAMVVPRKSRLGILRRSSDECLQRGDNLIGLGSLPIIHVDETPSHDSFAV